MNSNRKWRHARASHTFSREPSRQELVRDGLATDVEAAEFLHVSRSTLWLLMSRHALPYARIPGTRTRRIPWSAIYELAESSLVGGALENKRPYDER